MYTTSFPDPGNGVGMYIESSPKQPRNAYKFTLELYFTPRKAVSYAALFCAMLLATNGPHAPVPPTFVRL